ncbi:dUTP diphosphatase [Candidatus Pacearchaeota archaeon]|nr:dUTP diphosphatase [Candidatus Pacearchaeota archaeon]
MVKKKKKIVKKTSGKSGEKCCMYVKKIGESVCLPEYMYSSDVGLDLRANENVILKPLEQKAVRTGIAINIPDGHVGIIRDRAGIVSKMNVHTAAGTFDPAYRGEVSVILINFSDETVEIEKGMRIAQIVIIPVTRVKVVEVQSLPVTERYDKGFGSTGMKERISEFKKLEKSINSEDNED